VIGRCITSNSSVVTYHRQSLFQFSIEKGIGGLATVEKYVSSLIKESTVFCFKKAFEFLECLDPTNLIFVVSTAE